MSLVVLSETEWVLRSRYRLDKPTILRLFTALMEARELAFEDEEAIEEALFRWKDTSIEFTDSLIAARYRRLGCDVTVTFDAKAARMPGFRSA